nr:hypothetical protein [Tanacetum cinerariifolium]
MQQVQVNTKFLNALLPEWSKFATDVKLAKSLYTTNYDQLYAYLSQHERHAQEVCVMRERYPDPLALVANSQTLYNPSHNERIRLTTLTKQWHSYLLWYQGIENRGIATTSRGNYAAGQAKVVKCYNYLGEGHMAKQFTQPKRQRNSAWFKEKLMLVEAQEAAFQTEDLNAYDSDCDDISSVKVVLMANLLSYDSDVLSEVPYFDTYLNDMINHEVKEMPYFEQTHIVDFPDNEITSDSNIIPYSQYLQESQDAGIQDTHSFAPNELLVLSLVEQMTDRVANLDKEKQTNKMVNETLTAELDG